MPFNLLVKYNSLLSIEGMTVPQRKKSLKGVFDRDIRNNSDFSFRKKKINPTTADGEDSMERLFKHLTTVITDKKNRRRDFENSRSIRLHWIKYHLEELKKENIYVFSVEEPEGKRTYIYDKEEEYIIVLEPLRMKPEYFLLSAYHLEGKDKARNKMMKKYGRRLQELL